MDKGLETEIDLTVEDITQGSKFARKLVLKSENPNYNGKTVSYRALTGREFSKALAEAGLSRNQDPSESYNFLIEVGKIGVTTPGIGAKFENLDHDLIDQIGAAILGITQVSEKQVDKFFQK